MNLFVKQSAHDAVVKENEALKETLAGLTGHSDAFSALQTENERLDGLVQELTTQNEAFELNLQTVTTQSELHLAELEAARTRVAELETQVQELSELPGATSAVAASKTEANHGEAINSLEQANEFCQNNADDIKACIEAIKKIGI
jgi:chromosome segregation ATPase